MYDSEPTVDQVRVVVLNNVVVAEYVVGVTVGAGVGVNPPARITFPSNKLAIPAEFRPVGKAPAELKEFVTGSYKKLFVVNVESQAIRMLPLLIKIACWTEKAEGNELTTDHVPVSGLNRSIEAVDTSACNVITLLILGIYHIGLNRLLLENAIVNEPVAVHVLIVGL